MTLKLDPEVLNTCVACGLCLPHCPTYRVTGEEARSPRGRIDAMRAVVGGRGSVDDDFVAFMDTCVGCRGCEPACPSGVQYGALIDATRTELASQHKVAPRWLRTALGSLRHHRLVLVGTTALALAQRVRLVPRRLIAQQLGVRRGPRIDGGPAATADVWLFTGCVMDAWYRNVHRATVEVLDRLGVSYAVPGAGGACCGALQQHAGLADSAESIAGAVMASMPGNAPILVNSAGCGAHLKEYGHVVGTPDAEAFAARVQDIHEWLAPRASELSFNRLDRPVIVHDPCHLRHVQRVDGSMYAVLDDVVDVVTLDDDGLCCGAGGAFSIQHPSLAADIRQRKMDSIDRAREGAPTVERIASANPGCSMHLAGPLTDRGLTAVHPIELVAEALR